MSGFFTMLKSNIKLVFRNKASIFLILLIPLASTFILRIPLDREDADYQINRINVHIYDGSNSSVSKELIRSIEENGYFFVTLEEVDGLLFEDIKEKATDKANRSSINQFIYIDSTFKESILEKNDHQSVTIFTTGTDERINLLKNNTDLILSRFITFSKVANGDEEVFNSLMKQVNNNSTEKEIVKVGENEGELNNIQTAQVNNFGYMVAIMGVILILSGNFLSFIFIEEKKNKVLKRISITKSSLINYGLVKASLSLVMLIIQVIMIVLGIKLFVNVNIGITLGEMAILIFALGLIFNSLSIALGCIFENENTSNYLSFFITTLSSLLSGLYFTLDFAPNWMKNLSLLMPQRWIVSTARQLILDMNGAIVILILVVFGYMALFLTAGFVGLKVNSK